MKRQPALVRRQPAVLDIGAALLLAALSLFFEWRLLTPGGDNPKLIRSFGSPASWHWHLLVWWLASAAALGVLPMRRRFPVAVFAVTLAAGVVHVEILAFPLSPVDAGLPAVARRHGRRVCGLHARGRQAAPGLAARAGRGRGAGCRRLGRPGRRLGIAVLRRRIAEQSA